jgi:DNA-binding transcriptional regulator LsrR (DeoR family)
MAAQRGAERRDFLIETARLYYQQGLSQEEIARRFGISRSSVSLALKACREEKIVEIRIQDSSSPLLRLQSELEERYRLTRALVVPAEADAERARDRAGQAAAAFLEGELSGRPSGGLRIGLSWGTTLFQVVRHVRPLPLSGVEVIQLHGGLGAEDPAIDAFGLAQSLAAKLNGRYRIIQAPLSVASHELRDLLVREPGIAETLKLAARADLAVFGVGSNRPRISALVRTGYLSAAQSERLLAAGAVGTVCGLHIDARGRPFPCPWNERVVGIEAAALLRIPRRVGVAAGPDKAEAVKAALLGGLIGTLVTDEGLARKLLAL